LVEIPARLREDGPGVEGRMTEGGLVFELPELLTQPLL
jgi:hypothetical protein